MRSSSADRRFRRFRASSQTSRAADEATLRAVEGLGCRAAVFVNTEPAVPAAMRYGSVYCDNIAVAEAAARVFSGKHLGNFAFVSPRLAKKSADVAHEQEGHTWDSKLFGPLYLFVIGLPSLIHASMNNYECYFDFYTERWANKHADVEVLKTADGRCFLSKKNIGK